MWLGRLLLSSPGGLARALRHRGPSGRRLLKSSIDSQGCAACGCTEFSSHPVIDSHLANSWRLNSRERKWFDEREGHSCTRCGMSKRVRMIVWTLNWLNVDITHMDVLHVNQINHLSSVLEGARTVCNTCFSPGKDTGRSPENLIHQDLTNMTFADNMFDLVVHSETLEHVFDPDQALSEVNRVLRPGGFQIYTVPLLHTRRTLQRARIGGNGSIMEICEASFHGLEAEDLVVWEFGGDFLGRRAGSIGQICYDDFSTNPTVFTVVERSRH